MRGSPALRADGGLRVSVVATVNFYEGLRHIHALGWPINRVVIQLSTSVGGHEVVRPPVRFEEGHAWQD
jgi:hypothetical protein